MQESEIIRTLFPGKSFPEDDCYFLSPDTLVTTDSLVEGTHFLHEWSSPTQIAEKLIEVNVSDIAASGGKPRLCFLNLGLSLFSKEEKWVKEFTKSFLKRLKEYKMDLVGGDTFYSQTTHLTLTVFGKTKQPWFRSGGKEGDFLYLTGSVGNSELGLQILNKTKTGKGASAKPALAKHLSPKSRVPLVSHLQKFEIHACMDLTDGIIQDSRRMALASKGKLEIDMDLLPIDKFARENLSWDEVLSSGEELELLFLSPNLLPSKIGGVPVTRIGRFLPAKKNKKKKVVEFSLNGSVYEPQKLGFLHFQS
ncbi:thiamine-phosphate kinase [Leptospira idonii]|uniref:Thiamine-monophosphate kinase n=1 Tax=Leptospira idonii TaxID=1193500 RepID=A0A4R9M2V5_9LEPT|nr:thiamine-phosphate kinase [Leptospira idonii]TGN20077.1 thiamine-phosphate kinase [Leptospira idonii]